MSDIVSVTGDGANVMVAFGELLAANGILYLICHNHTINLAVSDEIFTKKTELTEATSDAEDSDSEPSRSDESREEFEAEESEPLVDMTVAEDFDSGGGDLEECFKLQPNFNATIKQIREIIKIFRYSPKKTAYLEAIM